VLGAPLSIFCSRDAPYTEADARRYLQLAREGYCPPYEWRGAARPLGRVVRSSG
jgi:hypothetical protein